MPNTQGNPGRGGLVLRGADARRPEPPPAGRPSRVSAPGVLLAAFAVVVAVGVPAAGGRSWPLVVLLGGGALLAQAATTLAVRRERARVAAIVERHHRRAGSLPYFG